MTDKQNPEQYLLRVACGSHLERFLDALNDDEFHDKDRIKELYGTNRGPWLLNRLAEWCDNFTADDPWGESQQRIRYVNPIAPTIVQNIEQAEFRSAGQFREPVVEMEVCEIIWPDTPPLISPDPKFVKPAYYAEVLAMVEGGRHISLEGPPGTGKSTCIEQMAAERGIPLVHVGGEAGLRKRDMVGSPEIVNGTTKFMVAEYAAAAVFGWWVKVDEVNAAEADAIMLMNGNLAPPYIINIHGKQYPVHPDFRVFITYNHGYVGTKPLSQSLKDRFYPVKISFPSRTMLRRILVNRGVCEDAEVDDRILGQVLDFAEGMWEANQAGQLRYQISPRRLIDAVYLMSSGIMSDVKIALRRAVIDVIDYPIEHKTALQVLDRVIH